MLSRKAIKRTVARQSPSPSALHCFTMQIAIHFSVTNLYRFLPFFFPISGGLSSEAFLPKRFSLSISRNVRRFFCLSLKASPMAPSVKVVAEYAKSNRSSCKKCSNNIAAKELRLGLVSRDARGFDMTRWFHLNCCSFSSESIGSAEAIKGFESLKGSDQDAVKQLISLTDQSEDKVPSSHDEENNLEERRSKKVKLSVPDSQPILDLVLSASDIKDMYKDAVLSPKWKAFQTIIFLDENEFSDSRDRSFIISLRMYKAKWHWTVANVDSSHNTSKIAAFDFDGCLAKTSVKRVGPDAWSLMFPSIPDKLQSLHNDGYKLVIFTNESNIERWKKKRQVAVDSKLGRLNSFIKLVNVPIQVFIACGVGEADDPYRKPKPGMWRIMEQHFNSNIPVDLDQSFYVGDAAGRANDHSDADIKFAEAIGLKFYVPEEYFGA